MKRNHLFMHSSFTLGIIGYGKFGKLLETIITSEVPNVSVRIYDRNVKKLSGRFHTLEEVCKCDFLIPAVPINQIEPISKQIANLLGSGTTVVDVASVKEYPVEVYKENFAPTTEIIATHPMFGPGNFDTSKPLRSQMAGLNLVISNVSAQASKYNLLKNVLQTLGLNVVEMSPSDHDRVAAKSQFLTLVIAFTLKNLNFSRSNIDTKSAASLRNVVDMVTIDKKLLQDIYKYNRYCAEELIKLQTALNITLSNFVS